MRYININKAYNEEKTWVLVLVFQISCDSRHRLRSYCGETARR